MKKTVTLITAAVLLSSAVFAHTIDNTKVTRNVEIAFTKDFAEATQVKWEKKENFYFAEFAIDGTRLNAAYTEDGELLATSRTINLTAVPLAVTQALNKKYKGYQYAEVVTEITFQNETNYYITIGNEKKLLYLKIAADGDITLEKRVKR